MMIKVGVLVVLVIAVFAGREDMKNCFESATDFKDATVKALEKRDLNHIIDDLEKVFETYPSLLENCGAEDKSDEIKEQIPPACSKILSKEAKLLVKIMRLYNEGKEKNEKAIALNSALFETLYKTQVQKKCPLLVDHKMMEVKNKGQCAEGMYRLSLVFEKLDNDLIAGKFNSSLTDMGKVIEKIPDTLDSCSQQAMAKWVRTNLPHECLGAVGALVRELATLEHNYTHIEWLRKHMKDFTSAVMRVKAACPALEH